MQANYFSLAAYIRQSSLALGAAVVLLTPAVTLAVPLTDLPDLSPLAPYAFLGNSLNLNLATVNGNVGISSGGTFMMSAPSAITGQLDLDTGATTTIANGANIGGFTYPNATAVHQPVDLSAAQALVGTASTTLKGFASNYSLGSVTTAQTFNAVDPVTVIDLGSVSLGGSSKITLIGGTNAYFVVNVANGVDFTGSSGIVGSGGVDPSHILLNFYSNSLTGVVADINTALNGTMFVPNAGPTFHSENGAIYGGAQQITFMSGATLTSTPFISQVPEPPTLALFGAGVFGIWIGRSRRQSSRPRS